MGTRRTVKRIVRMTPTMEGAGVRLNRGFGFGDTADFDPFLLFDDFSGEDPEDYKAGFPWHPHRGIETVTYILKGSVAHEDSIGNKGVIGPGDLQWMSAGSGIVHQEMPQISDGGIEGFQLWVNLPRAKKMSAPQYQDIQHDSVREAEGGGALIRVIAGKYKDVHGPVEDIAGSPTYLDVTLEPGTAFEYTAVATDTLFIYVIIGDVVFKNEGANEQVVRSDSMSLLKTLPGIVQGLPQHNTDKVYGTCKVREKEIALTTLGDALVISAGKEGTRFLLVSGTPLKESISWRGPVVMNTDEEIRQAFQELQDGTFIKS